MDIIPSYLTNVLLIFCATAFIKIATVLTIARYGIGLNDVVFGWITIVVALTLSFVVIQPWSDNAPSGVSFSKQVEHFRDFLEKNTDPSVVEKIASATVKPSEKQDPLGKASIEVTLASFIISQLKDAFQLGLYILIPFVVIDLLVLNIFMLLGITQVSVVLVALPIKLLLFLSVDGWLMISEKLLLSYNII